MQSLGSGFANPALVEEAPMRAFRSFGALAARSHRSWMAASVAVLLTGGLLPDAGADAGGWHPVRADGPVQGIDGRSHVARCSGYPGTDDRFRFWTRKGKSRNLVVYFEGGGACWDSLTCTFPDAGLPADVPQFYTPAIAADGSPADLDGLFNLRRDDNPVKDWDMVYIPYCTADLHAGAATRSYQNAGHPVFPLPSVFDIEHRGYDNLMVVLDWMKKHVDKPQRVLVAGSSAGGYGASIHFPWLRQLYPQAQVNVIADASQGVTTPGFDQGTPGRGSWDVQLPPWATGIDPTTIPGPQVLRRGAQAHPEVRVAQFTTRFDLVQVGFYGLMKENYGPGTSCDHPILDWNRQMVSSLREDRELLPNYRHYLAAGTYHTVLAGPEFYSERSAGPAFNDWLSAMVGTDDRQRRLQWRNVACLGCLIQLPCPN
jgi:hypothetical protein